jgi:altronate hydrolase
MKEYKAPCLHLHPDDNVLLALTALVPGQLLTNGVLVQEPIPPGHKVALRSISCDEGVKKYGQVIGFASREIAPGTHVHGHNLLLKPYQRDSEVREERMAPFPEGERAGFAGFVRKDGRVGTRNYLGVLATVNCSASVGRLIADACRDWQDLPGFDGVVALGHAQGCCQVPGGEAHRLLERTMAGYSLHPNFAGVLLVGLGCEVNQTRNLMEHMKLTDRPNILALDIQQEGGTVKTVRQGVKALRSLLPLAREARREWVSLEHFCLGLECGGSDAYSGITANPALGVAADLVVRHGGTVILSETPEIYGAEHLLLRRATGKEVTRKLRERLRWWEKYTAENGGSMDNNPSPGNKEGGISNIWEKSLGAVAKGGSTPLNDVYLYAERVTKRGLVFMDTPGYDVVSITGMVAGGANMICFTTGRGTVFGSKPVPTLKIASNSGLWEKMRDDMDINCGGILEGRETVAEAGERIFRALLAAAAGEKTASERHHMGDWEFVPWQLGAVT